MKVTYLLLGGLLACAPAFAADTGAMVGGAAGAAAGTIIGKKVGGDTGSVLGAAIGAATGVAIGGQDAAPAKVQAAPTRVAKEADGEYEHEHHDNGRHLGERKHKKHDHGEGEKHRRKHED